MSISCPFSRVHNLFSPVSISCPFSCPFRVHFVSIFMFSWRAEAPAISGPQDRAGTCTGPLLWRQDLVSVARISTSLPHLNESGGGWAGVGSHHHCGDGFQAQPYSGLYTKWHQFRAGHAMLTSWRPPQGFHRDRITKIHRVPNAYQVSIGYPVCFCYPVSMEALCWKPAGWGVGVPPCIGDALQRKQDQKAGLENCRLT